jgi:hypothetical protein
MRLQPNARQIRLIINAAHMPDPGDSCTAPQCKVPADLDIHIVMDNCRTHKTAAIRNWFAKTAPLSHAFHYDLRCWINLVERWFAEITANEFAAGSVLAQTKSSLIELSPDRLGWPSTQIVLHALIQSFGIDAKRLFHRLDRLVDIIVFMRKADYKGWRQDSPPDQLLNKECAVGLRRLFVPIKASMKQIRGMTIDLEISVHTRSSDGLHNTPPQPFALSSQNVYNAFLLEHFHRLDCRGQCVSLGSVSGRKEKHARLIMRKASQFHNVTSPEKS